MDKVNLLKKMQVQVKMGKAGKAFFHYPLGNKGKLYHKYHARHPFLPYLYWNGISGRIIVSPLRTWVDPNCNVCDPMSDEERVASNKDGIFDQFETTFGTKQTAKSIAKVIMKEKGVNTYSKTVTQGVKLLGKYITEKKISPEDIAERYGLSETITRNRGEKKPNEEILKGDPLKEKDET